jgi:adenylosuccinate synthase
MILDEVEPIYTDFKGWNEPTYGLNRFEDLNSNARKYISALEELCGAPIVMISTGPKREDTIIRNLF